MQLWEYKTLFRRRGYAALKNGSPCHFAEPWDYYSEDGNPIPVIEIPTKLRELGAQGWELVAISPRSSFSGGGIEISGRTDAWSGKYEGNTSDSAGFTSEETWVFKRPIS